MVEKQKFREKKTLSDSFLPNLFLLSSKMSGFNRAVFTHGEQSQVFTAVILMKVFFLSIWNNCSSNRRGSSWLRGIAVRFTANLARNCKLRTPSSVLKGFIRVTCLGEVREVLPYLKAFFLHACWETISFEKHCWKHLPLIFAPSLGKISSRKLFLLCRFSLSYEYFSRICAKERGFLAEKHSLLF